MSRESSTNPAYAFLARQVAITDRVIAWLTDSCYGTTAQEPQETIICEQMPRGESVVPGEDILHFIEEMKDRKTKLESELSKFNFVRRPDDDLSSPTYKHLQLKYADHFPGAPQPTPTKGRKRRQQKAGA